MFFWGGGGGGGIIVHNGVNSVRIYILQCMQRKIANTATSFYFGLISQQGGCIIYHIDYQFQYQWQ